MAILQKIMPQSEFRLWQAEYGFDPFGQARADAHAAMIAWTIACVFTPKDAKKPKLEDFKILFEKKSKQNENLESPSEDELLENAKQLQSIFGGTIEKINDIV